MASSSFWDCCFGRKKQSLDKADEIHNSSQYNLVSYIACMDNYDPASENVYDNHTSILRTIVPDNNPDCDLLSHLSAVPRRSVQNQYAETRIPSKLQQTQVCHEKRRKSSKSGKSRAHSLRRLIFGISSADLVHFDQNLNLNHNKDEDIKIQGATRPTFPSREKSYHDDTDTDDNDYELTELGITKPSESSKLCNWCKHLKMPSKTGLYMVNDIKKDSGETEEGYEFVCAPKQSKSHGTCMCFGRKPSSKIKEKRNVQIMLSNISEGRSSLSHHYSEVDLSKLVDDDLIVKNNVDIVRGEPKNGADFIDNDYDDVVYKEKTENIDCLNDSVKFIDDDDNDDEVDDDNDEFDDDDVFDQTVLEKTLKVVTFSMNNNKCLDWNEEHFEIPEDDNHAHKATDLERSEESKIQLPSRKRSSSLFSPRKRLTTSSFWRRNITKRSQSWSNGLVKLDLKLSDTNKTENAGDVADSDCNDDDNDDGNNGDDEASVGNVSPRQTISKVPWRLVQKYEHRKQTKVPTENLNQSGNDTDISSNFSFGPSDSGIDVYEPVEHDVDFMDVVSELSTSFELEDTEILNFDEFYDFLDDWDHRVSMLHNYQGVPEGHVHLRRNKSLSPHPDRPKSEIAVRWADGNSGDYDMVESPVKMRHRDQSRDRPRPKSDLDDNIHLFDELFDDIMEDFAIEGSSFLSDRMKAFGSEINLQPYCSLRNIYEMRRRDLDKQKNRRMSTPHPIKTRLQSSRPHKLHKQPPLVRSSSMPESLEKIHKRRKMHHLLDFHLDSLSRHIDIDDCMSDGSDLSFDQASLQERSVSIQSSNSQLTSMDEDEDNLTYAEALWDHITLDPEEIGFCAQDVIQVLDMDDKDWWYGVIDDREGWFPANFVRLRVNQDDIEEELDLDLDVTIQNTLMSSPKLRRISMLNKDQARSNVVNEIINAEREYVKHLKDVVEGYIQHARKRTEMFPEERIRLIFGNIETIYSFAQKFLSQLEMCIDVCPHLSEIGQCFLDNEHGFEIYSDYCNNHPSACEELDDLCKNSKYKHFFEACRLLQELVEIPLEGFLLTPVQKICKYPLQLAELLKYTPPDHADYVRVRDALAAMRKIATLINERKRKMESIEKIAVWQNSVVDWEGADLLERSSELIFSGELNKINSAGWSQERFFFLFDHQLVYCKKELLKRHVFNYKGRIDLDNCDIIDIPDGKDTQYNVTVKHGWKFHEVHKDKWYLVYAKTEAIKQHWLKSIKNERKRVVEDQENDFCVPDHWKQTVLNKVRSQSNLKDKQSVGRFSQGQLMMQRDTKDFTYSTLPRVRASQKHDTKKKAWFKFGTGKKSKR